MVLLKSTDIPLGSPAPTFSLPSVDGKHYSLDSFPNAKGLVVMFICNHCPYVQAVEERILELNREFHPQGVQFVGICSNDPVDYPEDSPAKLLQRWKEKNYGFPYLFDESQQTARDYGAVCTPELFVFDAAHRLFYHGRIDDHWQDPSKVTQREMAKALQALLAGGEAPAVQHPSMGCSIKWKK